MVDRGYEKNTTWLTDCHTASQSHTKEGGVDVIVNHYTAVVCGRCRRDCEPLHCCGLWEV